MALGEVGMGEGIQGQAEAWEGGGAGRGVGKGGICDTDDLLPGSRDK